MKGVPLNDELYKYIVNTFAAEDDILENVVRGTEAGNIPLIQVSPELGKLLHILVKMVNAKRVLEIGTLAGYSAIWMARALEPGAKLTTLEISKEHADFARGNFKKAGLEDKIELIYGNAMVSLDKLSGEKFDFCFLDADKTGYPAYYDKIICMMNKGGVIAADNTLKNGNVISREPDEYIRAIQIYNQMVADDPRVDSMLIPISDGLTICRVK